MNNLKIKNPHIVYRDGNTFVIMSENDQDPMGDAQSWTETNGYSEVSPFAKFLKWFPMGDAVDPEIPWHGTMPDELRETE